MEEVKYTEKYKCNNCGNTKLIKLGLEPNNMRGDINCNNVTRFIIGPYNACDDPNKNNWSSEKNIPEKYKNIVSINHLIYDGNRKSIVVREFDYYLCPKCGEIKMMFPDIDTLNEVIELTTTRNAKCNSQRAFREQEENIIKAITDMYSDFNKKIEAIKKSTYEFSGAQIVKEIEKIKLE
jgi:transcription elongation factor Elf1